MENNILPEWQTAEWQTCECCGSRYRWWQSHDKDDCIEELQAVRAKLESQVAELTLEVEKLRKEVQND